jgi:hypothetical protein
VTNQIGTLRETSLHAALKEWYAEPGDHLEVLVDGFHIDLIHKGELVEIQTANFRAIKRKIKHLLREHKVRLVYPIAREKWIVREDARGRQLKTRKSPKRGRVEDLFNPLVSMPELVMSPDLTVEVLLIKEEVVWRDDGRGSWRRKGWSIADHRLISVKERIVFGWPDKYLSLLPDDLGHNFTNRDLAGALKLRLSLARKMTYCLSKMMLIECIGRQGRFNLYRFVQGKSQPSSSAHRTGRATET